MQEPDWDRLFARIESRYGELRGKSEARLISFVAHVENLGDWEKDIGAWVIPPQPIAFPETPAIAFATCQADCRTGQFIVDGSTQECQRCGRLLFRHEARAFKLAAQTKN